MHIIHNVNKERVAPIPRELFEILPSEITGYISHNFAHRHIEEIRLRADRNSSIVSMGENLVIPITLEGSRLAEILNKMCGGSLYAFSDTIRNGYVPFSGGIRVGVIGRATTEDGKIIGVYDISSLCIRIPHRIQGCGGEICTLLNRLQYRAGVLIYSPPGVGKTTVLRGVCRQLSTGERPRRVVLVDSRGELSFDLDERGMCIDILSGYPRGRGIEIATRVMNPELIVCDEIGDTEEALELVAANNCGVPLLATAHAGSLEELLSRTGIRLLHESGVFGAYVKISRSGSMGFSYDVSLRREIGGYVI